LKYFIKFQTYSHNIMIIFYFWNKCAVILIRFVWDILAKNAHFDCNLNFTNFDINHNWSYSNYKDDDSSLTTTFSLTILQIYRRKICIFVFLCKKNFDVKHSSPNVGQQSSRWEWRKYYDRKTPKFPTQINELRLS
jgi:hypothetical protein